MEMDGDSESGRILENLALSLNQHSKLTALSLGFINMERHKSMPTHTRTTRAQIVNFQEYVSWETGICLDVQESRCPGASFKSADVWKHTRTCAIMMVRDRIMGKNTQMCVQIVALVVDVCFLKEEKQSSDVLSSKSHTEGGAFGTRDSQGFNTEAPQKRPCFWKVEETIEAGGMEITATMGIGSRTVDGNNPEPEVFIQ